MDTFFIPVILGTGREGRQSEKVAKYVLKQVASFGFETELIDVRDYPASVTARVEQEQFDDKGLQKKMVQADGYIIVAPEYNNSFPGELKIFIDHYYPEYEKKPMGICGVSGGPWGGVRCIQALRLVIVALKAVNLNNVVMFSEVTSLFHDSGAMKDSEMYDKHMRGMLEEIEWYARALKSARLKEK